MMHGLAIGFASEKAIVGAARALRADGVQRLESYSPYPIEALDPLMPPASRILPVAVFGAACCGIVFGFALQWYAATVSLPLDIGGRPLASWPAFIPIAFEIAVLITVLTAFGGFFVTARLPRLHETIMAARALDRVTQDRFVLYIDAADPAFAPARLQALIEPYGPATVEIIKGQP